MKTLNIDIETYSSALLPVTGVYKYVESRDFEILLFAYSIDGQTEEIVDLAQGEKIPQFILDALVDDSVLKYAYNAQFERVCLSRHLDIKYLSPSSWRCTAVHASSLGLPGNLAAVAEVLKLSNQKMKTGKSLISYFCQPCKPTKVNGGRTRNLPKHDLEKWKLFKEYCKQDVVVERAISKKLRNFELRESEWELYEVDQHINDNGILIDTTIVKNVLAYNDSYVESLIKEAERLTGLNNPNSLTQLKEWLLNQGVQVDTLTKKDINNLLKQNLQSHVCRVLEIRQQLGKTSIKKYYAMNNAKCKDNRIRGTMQFYGANRTGRWAGRLLQVQNLPRNADDVRVARKLVAEDDFEMLELFYDDLSSVFSQLIRPTLIPAAGKKFIISDFAAIEARVIAWLAGETWRNEVFATHGKIYEASAAQMFKLAIEDVTKDLRQKGKIAELALGYGGGPGALKAMGALEMGLDEDELRELVNAWRNSNKKIVQLWYEMNNAAIEAVRDRKKVKTKYNVTFSYEKGMLFAELPSGRRLAYVKPHMTENRFGGESVGYWGVDQTRKIWSRQETYGGKLVENIVQALARDCLAETLLKLDASKIIMHVHDEVLLEIDEKEAEDVYQEVSRIMSESPNWAHDLKLSSDGMVADYYQK